MNLRKSLLILFILVLFSACSSSNKSSIQGNIPDDNYIFNIKTYNISKGDTIRLNYRKVDPSAGAVVRFVSNNLNVAQVNSNGEVTGISAGTAQVEISITTSGITQKDICTINVKDDIITYLSYAAKELVLAVNETVTPRLIILPESARDNTVEYTLRESGIIELNELTGEVKGIKTGSTVLTATAGKLSTSINIIVKESVKPVTDITLSETTKTLVQGETYQINPTISPDDADNKNVTYSSSDKTVAVVLPNGTVVGENPGTAVITVETVDGKKQATLSVTVQESTSELEFISIDENVILEAGTSKFVTVQPTPPNARYSGLSVKTYNDAVTVTPVTRTTLLVTAKKQGYLTDVEVEALDCGKPSLDCSTVFKTFTIDNATAKQPEALLTVEPYNIIQEDATNYKIKIAFDKHNKLFPVNAVKKYPSNSKVAADDWDILLPTDGNRGQILVKGKDNSVYAQGTGKALMVIGILGNDAVKPVIFDVDVVAKESDIADIDKHCEISSIEINDEEGLKARLSKVGTLEFISAKVKYNSGNRCGIAIQDYSIETSDKNVIDVIDGYAYAKKRGQATLTIIPNTMFNNKQVKKELTIDVTE